MVTRRAIKADHVSSQDDILKDITYNGKFFISHNPREAENTTLTT